jgi:hypothetical protein
MLVFAALAVSMTCGRCWPSVGNARCDQQLARWPAVSGGLGLQQLPPHLNYLVHVVR